MASAQTITIDAITAEGMSPAVVITPGSTTVQVSPSDALGRAYIEKTQWDISATANLELVYLEARLQQMVVASAFGLPDLDVTALIITDTGMVVGVGSGSGVIYSPTIMHGIAPQELAPGQAGGIGSAEVPSMAGVSVSVPGPVISSEGATIAPDTAGDGSLVLAAGTVDGTSAVSSPTIPVTSIAIVSPVVSGTAIAVRYAVDADVSISPVQDASSAGSIARPTIKYGSTDQELLAPTVTGTGGIETVSLGLTPIGLTIGAISGVATVETPDPMDREMVFTDVTAAAGAVQVEIAYSTGIAIAEGIGAAETPSLSGTDVTDVAAPVVSGTGTIPALRIIYGVEVLQELFALNAEGISEVSSPTVTTTEGGITVPTVEGTAGIADLTLVPGPVVPVLAETIDATGAIAWGSAAVMGFIGGAEQWGPADVQGYCTIVADERHCVLPTDWD